MIERIRQAGQKSPVQKWTEFLALMEFGLQIKLEPSKYERKQKMTMLTQYYQAIEKLERWRKKHGKSHQKSFSKNIHQTMNQE